MRKDKRGLALITAIAVLALMLILFGGLAMMYSAQENRNKYEFEQSQAMLTAQSVSEMLNQVLTSSDTAYDPFKKELGNISANRETEIMSSLTQVKGAQADVKITAKAEKAITSGNSKTRKIKIKVSAAVNGETRSILSDYTFQLITGGSDLTKYAVYGNQIKSYVHDYDIRDDRDGEDLEFDGEWYRDEYGNKPIDPENYLNELLREDAYRFGSTSGKQPTTILSIEKDDDTLPETETELTNEDFNDYAAAKNGSGEPAVLSLWNANMQPDADTPHCNEFRSENWKSFNINKSCIWDFDQVGTNPDYKVRITASTGDIIIYLPVDGHDPVLSNLDIKFNESEYNLFFYAYSVSGGNTLKIAPDVEIKSERKDNEPLDVYFVSNDDIDLHIQSFEYREPKKLEAYFYLPRGKAVLYSSDKWRNKKRIEGCVVADSIALFDNQFAGNKKIGVSMEYLPPDKNVLDLYMTGGGSGTETISYKLNNYEEGGKS